MAIPLRLDTDDVRIAYELLSGDTSLEPGTEVRVPGGAKLRFTGRVSQGRAPARGRLEFELTETTRASAEPLAACLYERLRSRVPTVRLGALAVRVEREALRRALVQGISRED